MLTDPKLRSQVDPCGISSGPADSPTRWMLSSSFLICCSSNAGRCREPARRQAMRRGSHTNPIPEKCAGEIGPSARPRSAETCPGRSISEAGSRVGRMAAPWGIYAERRIQNNALLLIEACNAIDEMKISAQNQDVQGDLYEYLLSHLNAGRAPASSARPATSSA